MTFKSLNSTIESCEKCPRLRKHCLKTAEVKKSAYLEESYWGRPITGFGDHQAELVIIGLAPAAHGANRTGRVFTGDRSGEWLYSVMHRHGFANLPESTHREDSLKLHNAYITCAVKCAPPGNKPSPHEAENCLPYLVRELALLKQAKVILCLGSFAYQTAWPILVLEAQAKNLKNIFLSLLIMEQHGLQQT